jgi:RimJ/RimL family protein N-acetyltransferase
MPPRLDLPGRSGYLRPVTPAEARALRRHLNDPDVRRFLLDDREVPLAAVEAIIDEPLDAAMDGPGLWALELWSPEPVCGERPTPNAFGPGPRAIVGTSALRRSSVPEIAPLELVYTLSPSLWGRGLATDMGRTVLAHAFTTLHVEAVAATVDEANIRSAAVLRRLGMTHEPEATTIGPLGPVHVWVWRPDGVPPP